MSVTKSTSLLHKSRFSLKMMLTQKLTNATTDLEIISLWFDGKSSTTIATYRSIVKGFFAFLGDRQLKDVMFEDLVLYRRGLELRYKSTTIANKLRCIKSLLSFAQKIGYLDINVGSLVKLPKSKDSLGSKILPKEDIAKLIEAATARDSLMLKCMYFMGVRVSEVCNLRFSDLNNKVVSIFGKGDKNRHLICPKSLWDDLMLWKSNHRGEFVFLSRNGKQINRTRWHVNLKRLCAKVGVNEKLSSHWLRHAHSSHSLESGCSIRLLQASLGHSNVSTTERYLSVRPDAGSSQFVKL